MNPPPLVLECFSRQILHTLMQTPGPHQSPHARFQLWGIPELCSGAGGTWLCACRTENTGTRKGPSAHNPHPISFLFLGISFSQACSHLLSTADPSSVSPELKTPDNVNLFCTKNPTANCAFVLKVQLPPEGQRRGMELNSPSQGAEGAQNCQGFLLTDP